MKLTLPTRSVALGLVVLAGLSSLEARSADDDLSSRIDTYLGSMERSVTQAQWRALGPEALPILERQALAADGLPTVRARAAEAMGLAGGPEHGEKLLRLAQESEAPLLVRTTALRSAGQLLATERVEAAIVPLLSTDPQPRMRAAAAEVVAQRLGSSGCALVKKQLHAEPSKQHHGFDSALKRCK